MKGIRNGGPEILQEGSHKADREPETQETLLRVREAQETLRIPTKDGELESKYWPKPLVSSSRSVLRYRRSTERNRSGWPQDDGSATSYHKSLIDYSGSPEPGGTGDIYKKYRCAPAALAGESKLRAPNGVGRPVSGAPHGQAGP